MNDDKAPDGIRIIKKASCPSLSNRSELTYEFGCHTPSKTTLFRIVENTGNGHYHDKWIPLDAILGLLETAKEPFSLSIFKPLYPNLSINNLGFLGAVLVKKGVIVPEKRKYLRGDTKSLLVTKAKPVRRKKEAS